jgi:hypothetical protein
VDQNRLIKVLPYLVLILGIASVVIVLSLCAIDGFQQWVYLGAFFTLFFGLLIFFMYKAVERSRSRNERSTYRSAFGPGSLLWMAWILYLVVRASLAFPANPTFWQMAAFFLMCLAASLLTLWWRIVGMSLDVQDRKPLR